MPMYDNRLKSVPVGEERAYTSTMTTKDERQEWGIVKKLRFYRKAVKWLWKHRAEDNDRHKWRRMMREVQE